MTLSDTQRRRIVALLQLSPKTMSGGANVVAEALTDTAGCNKVLSELAEAIGAGIEDDSTVMDASIGRIVRLAVTQYALTCIAEG